MNKKICSYTGTIIDGIKFQFDVIENTYQKIITHGFAQYVNTFRNGVHFDAHQINSIICGVDSYHDNAEEDRRFRFKTCAPNQNAVQILTRFVKSKNCIFTGEPYFRLCLRKI